MYFDMYTVAMDGGRKVVSYEGFIWDGEETVREDGTTCHWRFDYCNERCTVPVSEKGADGMGLLELLMLEYEKYPQYSEPITDEVHDILIAHVKEHRVELNADDVTLDTPCGEYWFESDEE